LANTHYSSIVRLFAHCDIDTQAALNISRIRKQIVAEFAMAEDGFITIDHCTYNKNDVLAEIDDPNFLERWPMHQIVWQNKQILELLEDETINMDTIGQQMNDYRKDDAFIQFISPYLKTPFNNMCRSLLYPPQLSILSVFLKMQQFILPIDAEEAFSSVSKYLHEQERIMRNTTQQNYHINKAELLPWRNDSWSGFLNLLPNHLYEIKEDVVINLINLSVATQNTYSEDAKAYSAEMVKLSGIDAEHRQLILDNHRVFNSSKIGASGNTDPKSYWWIVWVIVIVIRLLMRL
jgi:hypothetical protein